MKETGWEVTGQPSHRCSMIRLGLTETLAGRFCSICFDAPCVYFVLEIKLKTAVSLNKFQQLLVGCNVPHSAQKFKFNRFYLRYSRYANILWYSGFGGLGVSMLASGTQDRGFAPGPSRRIFPDGKIQSMPSFRRGSKIIRPMLVTRTTKKLKNVKTVKMVKTVNYGTKKTTPTEAVGFFRLEKFTACLPSEGEGK
jgi:hypothetical protein